MVTFENQTGQVIGLQDIHVFDLIPNKLYSKIVSLACTGTAVFESSFGSTLPVYVSCSLVSDWMDCSLPGSSVCGIFQARILEWVAIAFSRGSSQPRDQTRSPTLQADSLPSEPPGKPFAVLRHFNLDHSGECVVTSHCQLSR